MGRLQPRRTDRKQAESLESYPGRTTTWRATCSRSRTPSGRERGIGPPPTTPKTSSASTATVRRRRAAHLNDTAEYVYDGEGNRVRKITASETTTYVYDAFGRLAAEYSTAGPSGTAGSYFRTVDHLGTTRLVTNGSAAVHDRRDLFPFGEQIADSYSNRSSAGDYNDANPASAHLFTGKERDEESGLDYFGARYMASTLGRFTSVDPANAGAKPANPQSWNAYAYVQNGPLSAIDPDGRATLLLDQDTQTREEFIESVAVKAPESLQGADVPPT